MSESPKGWPNVPVHVESFVHPHIPSQTPGMRRVFVLCEANEATIRSYLERTPFEYVSNRLLVDVSDFSGRFYDAAPEGKWPFMDCGVVVQARYKDIEGSYYLFEYEDQDYSILAGREMWGYPKTYADLTLEEDGTRITGRVLKKGKEIVRITADRARTIDSLPMLGFGPHLNVHTVPRGDGPGIESQRILMREASKGYQLKSQVLMEAELTLSSAHLHPLADLGPLKVLGGGFEVADSTLLEDGWAKVLERIV